LHIKLQTFQLDTGLVGGVIYRDDPEVRLAGLGTDAGKFRTSDGDFIIPSRPGVIKQLKLRFFAHAIALFSKTGIVTVVIVLEIETFARS